MRFLFIFFVSMLMSLWGPWWLFVVAGLLGGYLWQGRSRPVFLTGFFAVFLLWVLESLRDSLPNDEILLSRMANFFHLPGWPFALAVIGVVGGLTGGMAALSGNLLRNCFVRVKD